MQENKEGAKKLFPLFFFTPTITPAKTEKRYPPASMGSEIKRGNQRGQIPLDFQDGI